MSAAKVVIDIQGGEVVVEAVGFKGPACDAATRMVDEELSGQTKKRKPEYAMRPDQGQQAKARN